MRSALHAVRRKGVQRSESLELVCTHLFPTRPLYNPFGHDHCIGIAEIYLKLMIDFKVGRIIGHTLIQQCHDFIRQRMPASLPYSTLSLAYLEPPLPSNLQECNKGEDEHTVGCIRFSLGAMR